VCTHEAAQVHHAHRRRSGVAAGGDTARARGRGDRVKRRELISLLGGALLLSFICETVAANAAPVRIVAIGASNTHGWYVGNRGAYPRQLQTLLRAPTE
jgi:hypothetical protein